MLWNQKPLSRNSIKQAGEVKISFIFASLFRSVIANDDCDGSKSDDRHQIPDNLRYLFILYNDIMNNKNKKEASNPSDYISAKQWI